LIRLYEDGTIISYADSKGQHLKGGREIGKITKTFKMDSRKTRVVRSSVMRLRLKAKRSVLFCTLTFPMDITSKQANKVLSNYLDNLKTNFKLKNYVITRELTKRGRPHYHCVLNIPFTDFKKLNRAWCSAFSCYHPFVGNAFTTGRNPWVKDVGTLAAYITKYISKMPDKDYPSDDTARWYFISRECRSTPATIGYNTMMYLITKYESSIFVGDNFTVYKLKSFACLPEFAEPKERKPKKVFKPPARSSNADLMDVSANFLHIFPRVIQH